MAKGQERLQPPYYGCSDNFIRDSQNKEAKNEILRLEENFPQWEYDFKFEYENQDKEQFWNLDEETDSIKRLFKYKVNVDGFDCDGSLLKSPSNVCNLSREIYRKLWGWEDKNQRGAITRYGRCPHFSTTLYFGPDTMNSYMTVFNRLNILLEENGLYSKENKEIVRKKSEKKVIRRNYALYYFKLLIDGVDENVSWGKINVADWKKYAQYTHALGNFVLVPAYFNPYRVRETDDYWDQSLYLLKNKKEKWSYRNRNVYKEDILEDESWNKSSFVKYINYFYLWDYIVCSKDSRDCIVKSLWSNEFQNKNYYFDNDADLPSKNLTEQGEIDMFLENCLWVIPRRGAFMTLMLKIEQVLNPMNASPEKFSRLRKEVFAQGEKLYENYDEAIKAIMKSRTLTQKDREKVKEMLDDKGQLLIFDLCGIKVESVK